MNGVISTSIRVMVRPFRTYAELRDAPPPAFFPALRFLLVIGALVALTATARLAPLELATGMVSFAWIPLAQAIGLGVATRLVAPGVAFRRSYALYVQSIGPMVVLFLALSGLAAFDVDTGRPFLFLLMPGIVGATAWSTFLGGVMFRVGLGVSRPRAIVGAIVLLLVTYAVILGYYLAAGQLWPIVQ